MPVLRPRWVAGAVISVLVVLGSGAWAAAPAPPTYAAVDKAIDKIKHDWSTPGNRPATAEGWEALFGAIQEQLKLYGKAATLQARSDALDRLEQFEGALATTTWQPALDVLSALQEWSTPRRRVIQAEAGLDAAVNGMPPTNDKRAQAMRAQWLAFTHDELGKAFRDYEAATTVIARQHALKAIQTALDALDKNQKANPWDPSGELERAFAALFDHPNIDVVVDAATLAPLFDRNLVETGPVTRKGYVSQVTAGPKTGYGLVESTDGIAFYNSQLYTSITPIWDFQNQIASDRRGQQAAKLYYFSATSRDDAEIIITTVLRPSGLEINPSYRHSISGNVCSQPMAGGGLGRTVAAIVGMNQRRITNKVQDGAVVNFQSRIPAEAMEEGLERTSKEAETRTADLRSKFELTENSFSTRGVVLRSIRLRSNPEAAFIAGVLGLKQGPGPLGADTPPPPSPIPVEPGISARVHVGSLLTGAAAGLFEREEVREFKSAMILLQAPTPNLPLKDAVQVQKNVNFETFARQVDTARGSGGKLVALRVTRPNAPPEFRVDARGFLVALVHDVTIDVPAPAQEARGGMMGAPAKIYRLVMPLAEVAFSFKLTPLSDGMIQLAARVEEFTPGADAKVLAINDQETKAVPLSRFSGGIVLGVLGGQLRSRPINLKLDPSRIPGVTIKAISPLDSTGWLRVSLERKP